MLCNNDIDNIRRHLFRRIAQKKKPLVSYTRVHTVTSSGGGTRFTHAPSVLPDLLWTAPEVLRSGKHSVHGNKPADVYSFGIIVQEVVLRGPPYCMLELTAAGGWRPGPPPSWWVLVLR